MGDWPSIPLIRIISGKLRGVPLHGALAASAGLAAAGDVASLVDEARETEESQQMLGRWLPEPVLTLAHYALALLAECFGQ